MSDVTGPISTLPGFERAVEFGTMCDDHPDRPAVARVQGETDSFGSEQHDLCAECIAAIRKHAADDRCGRCDWCRCEATDLRSRRDYEEGMCGPVYRVCGACVKRDNDRYAQELAESDYDDYDYED